MSAMTELNRQVLIFAKANRKRLSYQLIGDRFGVSRKVVSGLLFRDRHDVSRLSKSPKGRGKNKIGTGYRPASYQPTKTAQNTR